MGQADRPEPAHLLSGPADRVGRVGLRAAAPTDLLALALSRHAIDVDANLGAAQRLLEAVGGIQRTTEISAEELRVEIGMDTFEALRLLSALELGRRAGQATRGVTREIGQPEDVVAELAYLEGEKQERFVVVLLDAKNRVIRSQTVHVGTLTQSLVGPREVFRIAVREGASAIIVAHNHPSGDPEPSQEDIQVTGRLAEVGKALDIPVLDHIIVGDPEWVSLRRRKLI